MAMTTAPTTPINNPDGQKSKAMRILAALRVNQGGSSGFGPMMKLQGDSKGLYPVEWREGFVDPYDHWRW